MRNISFLLGAGFSVNQGYPTANILNQSILSLTEQDFGITDIGTICRIIDNDDHTLNYRHIRTFLIELIAHYNKTYGSFNYEEFYDYYKKLQDTVINDDSEEIIAKYIGPYLEVDRLNLISRMNSIFNQVIQMLISDGNETRYYIKIHKCKGALPQYAGFLNLIEKVKKDSIIDLHTLNHDLFLEYLCDTDEFGGDLSNGFTEMGSPYYSESEYGNVRLEFFNNLHETNIRLFKLHGSFDQVIFKENGVADKCIKLRYGVDSSRLKKEIFEDGKYVYNDDITHYSSDFLSGTTSKILRYKEIGYYDTMFYHFTENLSTADKLIIVGYGFLDNEINKMINSHLREGTPIYVVDPYPSQAVLDFVAKKGAKLIKKTPREIELSDFDENL